MGIKIMELPQATELNPADSLPVDQTDSITRRITLEQIKDYSALDVTALAESTDAEDNDLLLIYDSTTETLKKIKSDNYAASIGDKFVSSIAEQVIAQQYYVGKVVEQLPNQMSPGEEGLPGIYEICNHRAYAYRLTSTMLPASTLYTPGNNYAVNDVVMYHLDGDDWAFFTANVAITGASEQLDPVKWNQVKSGDIIEQRLLHGYTEPDYVIGQQISGGDYDGYYVEEILVYGGKYFAPAGGNRPTFVSGGTAGDVSRKITGSVAGIIGVGLFSNIASANTGVLKSSGLVTTYATPSVGSANHKLDIDTSLGVPTGVEDSPRTISIRYWRRVA